MAVEIAGAVFVAYEVAEWIRWLKVSEGIHGNDDGFVCIEDSVGTTDIKRW